jgi:hypothetical protein
MCVLGRDGKTHRLDDRSTPHVYRDDEDNGVATQTEEALWSEIVSLREQLQALRELVRVASGLLRDALDASDNPRHRARLVKKAKAKLDAAELEQPHL